MKNSKKLVTGILATLMAVSMTAAVGCNITLNPSQSNTPTTSQPQEELWTLETVYAKAQDLGYEGSLEDFLATVQGKDGIGIKDIYLTEEGNW